MAASNALSCCNPILSIDGRSTDRRAVTFIRGRRYRMDSGHAIEARREIAVKTRTHDRSHSMVRSRVSVAAFSPQILVRRMATRSRGGTAPLSKHARCQFTRLTALSGIFRYPSWRSQKYLRLGPENGAEDIHETTLH